MRPTRQMDATRTADPAARLGRPRLTPGVPAGGIAAIAVTVVSIAVALVASGSGGGGHPHAGLDLPSVRVERSLRLEMPDVAEVHMRIPAHPAAPAPPAPPGASGPALRIDHRGIVAEARAARERTAALATAASDRMNGRGGEVTILERYENPTGETRIVAMADAPAGLRLANVYGDVRIAVDPRADSVRFVMVDSRKRYDLSVRDGILWITGPGRGSQPPARFEITVPPGLPLLVNAHVGDLTVDGDLNGPVRAEVRQGELRLGDVASASVRVVEAGSIKLGRVKGPLAVRIDGSGSVTARAAGSTSVELNGSGSVAIDSPVEGLVLALLGSGDVRLEGLSGPLRAALMGSGDVQIGGGKATGLEVASLGSADLVFRGTAVAPRIVSTGTGDVRLGSHDGEPRVRRTGTGDVDLGRGGAS